MTQFMQASDLAPSDDRASGRDQALTLSRRNLGGAILWGGLVAGVLDISDALIFAGVHGVVPTRLFQAIASGLLGRESFAGGLPTAALGLLLHFVIAFGAAATYALASLRLPLLVRRPWVCGPIFGICVHLVMKYVVLPLSLYRGRSATSWLDPGFINVVLAHVFCVGIPIALAARRAARRG
jgi:hypothetical protein